MYIVYEKTNDNVATVFQRHYSGMPEVDETRYLVMEVDSEPLEPSNLPMGKSYSLMLNKDTNTLYYDTFDVPLTLEQQLIQSREEMKSVRENTDNAIIEMTQLIMMMGGMSDV